MLGKREPTIRKLCGESPIRASGYVETGRTNRAVTESLPGAFPFFRIAVGTASVVALLARKSGLCRAMNTQPIGAQRLTAVSPEV